ncbi:tRNA uridine-5-carboxymethylaminomethyl(34) synthesis GTPase MnmE [Synoicihabitans lomoniglobus]|uniref:tRNA modification GTPase MnmE n=1 Tax=Synoicihabitans lomoniglobus TaxID=2909285 RepID=A0AAF0CPF9_9BACT|nr:tRNA uridine-5-carboxymethylaminomethyl(34) synthesis GTPase MnmE [Opitutaceae bacterium LMO-M01]WED64534.1 tRNA uridine-5-carboxymethylaminomethyl(34) synthesis GTPase MnmE [Opitutaceae bacterium LMO-M01]
MSDSSATIAAPATPAGTSAIAVVRVSGPECAALAGAIFDSPLPARTACHHDYRDIAGQTVDDVLVTFFAGPHSYTGEDVMEISTHGNPLISQLVLDDLFKRGCQPAEAGEFTRRAFLNGRLDLSQAEAVMDLIHARSARAVAAANQQLRGSLGQHMTRLTDELLLALARVEAYIDFPEEDLPEEDRGIVGDILTNVLRGTERLLATHRYGDLLRDGIKTVILGEPNAGKSSLLNTLIGRERALVSDEPGTTRDYLEETVIVGPHCLRLIDTAGLNPTPGTVEALGIRKTHERIEEADLCLLVLDCTHPTPPLPDDIAARLHANDTVVVLNKIDLTNHQPLVAIGPADLPTVQVSTLTGAGIKELEAKITEIADRLQPPEAGDQIAINARHADALRRATECLATARQNLMPLGPTELLASDLRGVLDAYGEIAGRIDNEDMLDRLFSTFCIGK